MAVIKAVNSRASIGVAVNYVTKDEKTEEKLISGIDCNPKYAIDEMKATKAVWNKTEGRQYKHFVQSFSPEEQITPEQAHKIAYELAQNEFKGFEVLIATHKDRDHIHSHIIVNSVSYENGKKFQQSKNELQQMKEHSDELCAKYDLSICEKNNDNIATYSMGKYKALERASKGKYKSYVLDTAHATKNAMQTATSRESFIILMKGQGYETEWSDKKKYITFTDKDGNKVRNSNIEKTFKIDCSKESLEKMLQQNLEKNIAKESTAEKKPKRLADFIAKANATKRDGQIEDDKQLPEETAGKEGTAYMSFYEQIQMQARNVKCDQKVLAACLKTIQDEHIEAYCDFVYKTDNLNSINKNNKRVMKELDEKNTADKKAVKNMEIYNKYLPIHQELQSRKLFKKSYINEHELELNAFDAAANQLKESGYNPDNNNGYNVGYILKRISENDVRITEMYADIKLHQNEIFALKNAMQLVDKIIRGNDLLRAPGMDQKLDQDEEIEQNNDKFVLGM